jgi:hypothetical protein
MQPAFHDNSRVTPLGGTCQSRRRASRDVAMLEGADPDIASLIRATLARASGAMAFAIRFETSTPRRLMELVIFRTAQQVARMSEAKSGTMSQR